MNVIKNLQDRITKRLLETSNPCKIYKTEAMAEKKAEAMAQKAAEHFDTRLPANYVIVYIERFDSYTPAFDINELCGRPDAKGGYVGIFGAAGYYSY